MQSTTLSGTSAESSSCLQWGLKRDITQCFGARLVQEGNRLYFLGDRAGFNGSFSDDEALCLDQAFPLIMKQLERMLTTGELDPHCQHCVTTGSPAKLTLSALMATFTSLFIPSQP